MNLADVVVEGGDHGGGHRSPLGGVDMRVAHDGITHVITVKPDEGHVTLVKDGVLDGPVPKTVNGVGRRVFSHLGKGPRNQ